MAKGRTYEMAFKIGGLLARSFYSATSVAGRKLTELQRKSAALALQQQAAARFSAAGTAANNVLSESTGLILGVAGAASLAGYGLFRLAKSTADVGDHAIKTAQNLGIGVEVLQELWYAAERSGVKTEDLDRAIRKMSVSIGQVAAGRGEAKVWFEQLGLSAANLSRMRPEEAMETLSDALRSITDPAQKAAASQAIFGEAALKLGVLLDEGSAGLQRLRKEARATGGVLSARAAKDSATFNDRLLDLRLTLLGLKNTVGSALLPVFTDLFTRLAAWLRTNQGYVRQLADRFAVWLRDSVPRLLDLLGRLNELALRIKAGAERLAEFVGGWDRLLLAVVAFKAAKVAYAVGELGVALANAAGPAWSLTAALLANPVTWLVAGILAEAAAIALLVVYWDEWTGWLQRSAAWIKVLAGYLLLIAPPLWLPLAIAATIHYWAEIVAGVRAFGAGVVRAWDVAREAVVTFAAAVWSKIVTVLGAIKLVVLGIAEAVWIVIGPVVRLQLAFLRFGASVLAVQARVLAAVAALVVGIQLRIWSLVGTVFGPVVQMLWRHFSWLIGVIWAGMAWLWEGLRAGWTLLSDWLTGLWTRWGETVKGVVRAVLAEVLNLTAQLSPALNAARLGLGMLNALPGEGSPHLVELRNQINALLGKGQLGGYGINTSGLIPTVEDRAPLGAPLGAALAARQTTTQSTALNVSYSPQITVQGGGEGGAAGLEKGLKAAEESLLDRLKGALEQEQRLAYG